MTMEITKALCLSTMHIHPSTAKWLDDQHKDYGAPFAIWEGEHGYFMPVLSLDNTQALDRCPVELPALFSLARANDCAFLRLDCDGPEAEGIPTFDWSDPA